MTILPLTYLRGMIEQSRFLRFLLSGVVNTATTYVIYLALLQIIDYRVAYTIAYATGILLAYALNRVFVFRAHRGWSSLLLFPLVYLAQYLASLAIVWVWVDKFGLPKSLAPLLAIIVTVPLTYVLSHHVFVQKLPSDAPPPRG